MSVGSSVGSASVVQEAQGLMKSGATLEQSLFRSGIVHNDMFFSDLIQTTEAGREAFAKNAEQYNAMVNTLNNYMGLAVNDVETANKYLSQQDTSWMGDSKDNILAQINKAIKQGGDLN